MLVRDCSELRGPRTINHIRVSVRTRRENTILAGRHTRVMPCIMVQGTMSGAGKSTIVARPSAG